MHDAHLALASMDWLTPRRESHILQRYPSLEDFWKESHNPAALEWAGLTQRDRERFMLLHKELDLARIRDRMAELAVQLLIKGNGDYPTLLAQTASAPMYLFVRGNYPVDRSALAVVGSRKMTGNGKAFLERYVPELVGAGLQIVSGLALGVDGCAHRITVERGGSAIAFLGSGVDTIYPAQNRHLAAQILEGGGAIVSEFPLGTNPQPQHFPRRNRLIAGSSLGALVVEGGENSGSLITAHNALDEGREVFAVPGSPLQPTSLGSNQLLQRGEAKLVLSADDILSELQVNHRGGGSTVQLTPVEQVLYEALEHQLLSTDELARTLKQHPSEVLAVLTLLQLKGIVTESEGSQWTRIY